MAMLAPAELADATFCIANSAPGIRTQTVEILSFVPAANWASAPYVVFYRGKYLFERDN